MIFRVSREGSDLRKKLASSFHSLTFFRRSLGRRGGGEPSKVPLLPLHSAFFCGTVPFCVLFCSQAWLVPPSLLGFVSFSLFLQEVVRPKGPNGEERNFRRWWRKKEEEERGTRRFNYRKVNGTVASVCITFSTIFIHNYETQRISTCMTCKDLCMQSSVELQLLISQVFVNYTFSYYTKQGLLQALYILHTRYMDTCRSPYKGREEKAFTWFRERERERERRKLPLAGRREGGPIKIAKGKERPGPAMQPHSKYVLVRVQPRALLPSLCLSSLSSLSLSFFLPALSLHFKTLFVG